MNDRLAHIISWVFLPLLMPCYALLITMYIPSSEPGLYQEKTIFFLNPVLKIGVLGLFFIFSFLLPSISLIILKKNNLISSIDVEKRTERTAPILLTVFSCGILAWFLITKAPTGLLPKSIILLPIGGLIAILISWGINYYDKISQHALGAGMLVGFLIAYYQSQAFFYLTIIVIAILISGAIMSARMYLGKHTLRQSLMGYFLGFGVLYLTIHYFS
jgi:hypothetical protein